METKTTFIGDLTVKEHVAASLWLRMADVSLPVVVVYCESRKEAFHLTVTAHTRQRTFGGGY